MTEARQAEQALAIGYAVAAARPSLATLLALDRRLGDLVAAMRQPMLAQMRLTWWHEALGRLDTASPPAEPLLIAIAAKIIPSGVTGASLAAIVDGWEALLEPDLDETGLIAFAEERGARLFAIMARLLGATHPALAEAGEGWALADLSGHLSNRDQADAARRLAETRLDAAFATRWPTALRPIGMLALLAKANLDGSPPGSPRRMARLLLHRIWGR